MKHFKLLFSLLLASTIVMVQSCSNSDDSDNNPVNTSIVGEWSATEFTATTENTTEFNGETYRIFSDIEGANFDYVVSFSATNFTTLGNYDMTSSTQINEDNPTTFTESYENVSGTGTYTIEGNVMTIDGSFFEVDGIDLEGAGSQTATFQLSADGQTLTFIQDEQTTQTTGGINSVVTITSRSVFVRL